MIVSTAYEQSGDIVLRVRDTGIGMTIAEIEQALKPFKQINALKRARGEGTGLGLPLTKGFGRGQSRPRFHITSSLRSGHDGGDHLPLDAGAGRLRRFFLHICR